jgi:hypothetical protein
MRVLQVLLTATVIFVVQPPSHAQTGASLAIVPGQITLAGSEARQRLLVEEMLNGQAVGQIADAVFTSSDEQVVEVEDGVAFPRGNGRASITAKAGGRTATAEVTVTDFDQPHRWNFRNHVLSVFTKVGCNSGSCHGAALGKKGFRLSLRGYDPDGDFLSITRQARGRRVVPSDPGRSLILLKPTGAVPHVGGVRFEVDSLEYRVVAEWLAAGTPRPRTDDPRMLRLELLPGKTVLRPNDRQRGGQQLVVQAHFSDGHVEDVTHWAKYASANESVAQVDQQGRVKVMGYGEGAITAWYLSQVATATISVPYDNKLDASAFAQAAPRNFVDELVLAKLRSLNIPPSPPAGDSEFLRRAFLDTIGVLPTAEETRAFLADKSPGKRDKLIEQLLARPEFVDYWTYKWCDLLLVNSERLPSTAMWSFYNWIRNHVAAGTPWDALVREIITAKGSTLENGAGNFFVLHKDPQDMAETTTQAFLGLSVGCAKCHNHPLEKWTNAQYYATANLYARVRTKDGKGESQIVFDSDTGDLIQPLSGKAQHPRPLDGDALPSELIGRRAHLARWVTSPENTYFARAIVNRVWANFLGVGIVEKVDDLRLSNPASNEELLAALANHLVKNKYDLKALVRVILQSATYQRSSQPLPQNRADERYYSHYYPKRLMAEVLLDAISQVTAAPTQFPGYPDGWRALQLPDSNIESYFLRSFGRAERAITCECERTAQPSMVQVLHIANGPTINQKLEAKGNRVERLLTSAASDEQIVDELYLAAFSRLPSADRKQKLVAVLREAGDEGPDKDAPSKEAHRQAVEDLFWSVLSSKEFLFNH